jgi:hypothetical protein
MAQDAREAAFFLRAAHGRPRPITSPASEKASSRARRNTRPAGSSLSAAEPAPRPVSRTEMVAVSLCRRICLRNPGPSARRGGIAAGSRNSRQVSPRPGGAAGKLPAKRHRHGHAARRQHVPHVLLRLDVPLSKDINLSPMPRKRRLSAEVRGCAALSRRPSLSASSTAMCAAVSTARAAMGASSGSFGVLAPCGIAACC